MPAARSLVLAALAAWSAGCAGPLVGPALEMDATRAALRASLNHDGIVEPPRGDVLALDVEADPLATGSEPLPVHTAPAVSPRVEPAAPVQEPSATASSFLQEGGLSGSNRDVARALEQLTREMSEQRMLMMMQLMSQRGGAPVVVDDNGRMTDIAVAVQRLEDTQAAQATGAAELSAQIATLQGMIDARMPEGSAERTADQLTALKQAVEAVPPALDELSRAQRVLQERIERLEGFHSGGDVIAVPIIVAPTDPDDGPTDAEDARPEPVMIELQLLQSEDETADASEVHDSPVDDETPDRDVVLDDVTDREDTAYFDAAADRAGTEERSREERREQRRAEKRAREGDPAVDRAIDEGDAALKQDRRERAARQRAAERAGNAEVRAINREARRSRRAARLGYEDERAEAEAVRREERLAMRLAGEPDHVDGTVVIAPVLVGSARRDRNEEPCVDVPSPPGSPRFPLDSRAEQRLQNLLDRGEVLVSAPERVELPVEVLCSTP